MRSPTLAVALSAYQLMARAARAPAPRPAPAEELAPRRDARPRRAGAASGEAADPSRLELDSERPRLGMPAGSQPRPPKGAVFALFGGAGGTARATPPAAFQAEPQKVVWRIKRLGPALSSPRNSCAVRRRGTPGTPR